MAMTANTAAVLIRVVARMSFSIRAPTRVLSVDDSGEVRRAALDEGLSLLQKPVRPLALESVVGRLLASRV